MEESITSVCYRKSISLLQKVEQSISQQTLRRILLNIGEDQAANLVADSPDYLYKTKTNIIGKKFPIPVYRLRINSNQISLNVSPHQSMCTQTCVTHFVKTVP